jgi:hypothetical protein
LVIDWLVFLERRSHCAQPLYHNGSLMLRAVKLAEQLPLAMRGQLSRMLVLLKNGVSPSLSTAQELGFGSHDGLAHPAQFGTQTGWPAILQTWPANDWLKLSGVTKIAASAIEANFFIIVVLQLCTYIRQDV